MYLPRFTSLRACVICSTLVLLGNVGMSPSLPNAPNWASMMAWISSSRSQGDTRSPLIVLAVSGVINVVLNLFFVVVVGMSVEGVALATIISNTVSAIVLLVKLMRRDGAVHADLRKLQIYPGELRQILRIGIPAGIQGTAFSLSNICIQSGVNFLGTAVMAASSAAFNVECLVFL